MRRLLLLLALPLAAAAQSQVGASQPQVGASQPQVGASQPQVGASQPLTVEYERFQLANGLDVILHRDASVPVVTVNTWYHVGSGREAPGRTGFAHLFEHLMFEGSGHVPEGAIDTWLEEAGGGANGSTTRDRTNYTTDAASNGLELALYLDADRMASLLDAMSPESVDGQRDVVKNERRQSYENRPYGLAWSVLGQTLYPAGHPYHWPTIGSMGDLSAASYQDVVDFFETYYRPNNASLVVAGDIDLAEARALVERWYGAIPRGPEPPLQPIATPALERDVRLVLEDAVQLPRLYLAWHSPARFGPADAAMQALASVLAGGKNSRLYRRLVFEMEIAQDVAAFQGGDLHSGEFYVIATARPGVDLGQIEAVVAEEIAAVQAEAPSARELERVVNGIEAGFLDNLETVDGFRGKADQLNSYLFFTGTPDFFEEDLARFRALAPRDLSDAAMTFLGPHRVSLSVVPEGALDLALDASEAAVPLF